MERLDARQVHFLITSTMLAAIGIALVSQHQFDMQPCQKCVEIRLAVVASMAISLYCTISSKLPILILHLLSSVYLLWKSIDNVFGEVYACGFGSPFPKWAALDEFAPWLFEVRGLCGGQAGLFTFDNAAIALGAAGLCLSLTALLIVIRRRMEE